MDYPALECSEEQARAVEQLRQRYKDRPEIYQDDWLLIRFVRARQSLEESTQLLANYLKWREEFQPERIRHNKTSIELPLKSELCFWHKHDKQGRPCAVVYGSRHFPKETNMEVTRQFVVYNIEKAFQKMRRAKTRHYVLIYDMKNFSYKKNLDTSAFVMVGHMLNYYPEVLGACYIINTDWVFKTFYGLLKKVFDARTLAKLVVLPKLDGLLEHFDPDALLPEHGGSSSTPYTYSLEQSDDEDELLAVPKKKKKKKKKQKSAKKHKMQPVLHPVEPEDPSTLEEIESFVAHSVEETAPNGDE